MLNKWFFPLGLLLLVSVSSCVSMGAGKWSAYSMTIQVNSSDGTPIKGAVVSSIDNDKIKTNTKGQAILYFRTKGLYVITVHAEGMETTQVKVTLPTDIDKIVSVFLAPLPN